MRRHRRELIRRPPGSSTRIVLRSNAAPRGNGMEKIVTTRQVSGRAALALALASTFVGMLIGAGPASAQQGYSGYSGGQSPVVTTSPAPAVAQAAPAAPAPAPAPAPATVDTKKVDPCASYMYDMSAYNMCQDRAAKIKAMTDAAADRDKAYQAPPPAPPPAPKPPAATTTPQAVPAGTIPTGGVPAGTIAPAATTPATNTTPEATPSTAPAGGTPGGGAASPGGSTAPPGGAAAPTSQ
jgi:hypothetical protein